MKILLLGGGLGNQIFEYYYSKYLKNKYANEKILGVVNSTGFKVHNGYEIKKVFNVDLPSISLFFSNILWLISITNKILPFLKISNKSNYNNDSSYFLMNGFCPNLEHYINESKIKFQINNLSIKNMEIINEIKTTESVSIHIRKGDYESQKYKKIFAGTASMEYYKESIKKIEENVKLPKFYVFSDDIEWTKKNIDIPNVTYITWNTGNNSYIDMYLMTMCKHHIIANSTFSYWGAYLSENNGIVIYPKKWFNGLEAYKIFPEDWINI